MSAVASWVPSWPASLADCEVFFRCVGLICVVVLIFCLFFVVFVDFFVFRCNVCCPVLFCLILLCVVLFYVVVGFDMFFNFLLNVLFLFL